MISARAGHGGERQAAAKALGHRDEVGGDAVMLHREQLAGAGKAGLHLVGDQHDAMLVADLADAAAPESRGAW